MKILNFGALNIDYVYQVPHFVMPGETISSTGLELFCGGKGLNQSIALARAGAQVFHAGCIGADGAMLTDTLRDAGADVSRVHIVEGSSGHAIIQVSPEGQNAILLFGGANRRIDAEQIRNAFEGFAEGDLLLIQNEISGNPGIMQEAVQHGMRIVLNPSPIDQELERLPLKQVYGFILNEIEGEALSGKKEAEDICRELMHRYPAEFVALTLGSRGAIYADRDGIISQSAYYVPVVDTTGAGDTFTGYFLSAFAQGCGREECLRRAVAASSLAVGRKGAAAGIPQHAEVDAFLAQRKQPI